MVRRGAESGEDEGLSLEPAKRAAGSVLRIRVTFEANLDPSQAKAKLDETRVQLRELGLDEGIE